MSKETLQSVNALYDTLTKQIERSEELYKNLTYNLCPHQKITIEGLKNCLSVLGDIANKVEAELKRQKTEEKLKKQQADKEKSDLKKKKEKEESDD